MADVVIVCTILALIALCVGYVEWCDRIIRRDDPAAASEPSAEPDRVEVTS
jgi:hypothetical protein